MLLKRTILTYDPALPHPSLHARNHPSPSLADELPVLIQAQLPLPLLKSALSSHPSVSFRLCQTVRSRMRSSRYAGAISPRESSELACVIDAGSVCDHLVSKLFNSLKRLILTYVPVLPSSTYPPSIHTRHCPPPPSPTCSHPSPPVPPRPPPLSICIVSAERQAFRESPVRTPRMGHFC